MKKLIEEGTFCNISQRGHFNITRESKYIIYYKKCEYRGRT